MIKKLLQLAVCTSIAFISTHSAARVENTNGDLAKMFKDDLVNKIINLKKSATKKEKEIKKLNAENKKLKEEENKQKNPKEKNIRLRFEKQDKEELIKGINKLTEDIEEKREKIKKLNAENKKLNKRKIQRGFKRLKSQQSILDMTKKLKKNKRILKEVMKRNNGLQNKNNTLSDEQDKLTQKIQTLEGALEEIDLLKTKLSNQRNEFEMKLKKQECALTKKIEMLKNLNKEINSENIKQKNKIQKLEKEKNQMDEIANKAPYNGNTILYVFISGILGLLIGVYHKIFIVFFIKKSHTNHHSKAKRNENVIHVRL